MVIFGFARREEDHEPVELFGVERAREGGHVRAAVRDADRDLILVEAIAHARQVRAATTAVPIDEVAAQAAFCPVRPSAGRRLRGRPAQD